VQPGREHPAGGGQKVVTLRGGQLSCRRYGSVDALPRGGRRVGRHGPERVWHRHEEHQAPDAAWVAARPGALASSWSTVGARAAGGADAVAQLSVRARPL
jgi:hypothetical protein